MAVGQAPSPGHLGLGQSHTPAVVVHGFIHGGVPWVCFSLEASESAAFTVCVELIPLSGQQLGRKFSLPSLSLFLKCVMFCLLTFSDLSWLLGIHLPHSFLLKVVIRL